MLLASGQTRFGWLALLHTGPEALREVGSSGPSSSNGLLVSARCEHALDLATGRIFDLERVTAAILPGFSPGSRIRAAAFSPSGRMVVHVAEQGAGRLLVRGEDGSWQPGFSFLAQFGPSTMSNPSFATPIHVQQKGGIAVTDEREVLVLDAANRLTLVDADGRRRWQALVRTLPAQEAISDEGPELDAVQTPHLFFVRTRATLFIIDRQTGLVLERVGGCSDKMQMTPRRPNEVHLPCEPGSLWTAKDLSDLSITAAGVRDRIASLSSR